MRRFAQAAGLLAAVVSAAGLLMASAIWYVNDLVDGARGLSALFVFFVALVLPPLAVVSMLSAGVLHLAGKRSPVALPACVSIAALFAWTWFGRFEPAHQPWSERPHLSCAGATGWCLLLVAVVAIVWPALRGGLSCVRATTWSAGTALGVSALGWALVIGQEPPRDRSESARALEAFLRVGTCGRFRDDSQRVPVLFVGVDGLDFRVLDILLEAGVPMPAFRRLFSEGQYWQNENLGMRWSPQIWASTYTGTPPDRHGVFGFSAWRLPGLSSPVRRLPDFGPHSILFLGRVLPALASRGIGEELESRTRDLKSTPIWRAASRSGLRVGVFDPVPFVTEPEVVNGFYTARRDSTYWAVFGDGIAVQRVERVRARPLAANYGALRDAERERRRLAAELFRRNAVDLAIYYTHFVDQAMHVTWGEVYHGRFLRCSRTSEAELVNGPVAQAYVEADETLRELRGAIGMHAVVVLVSDHGWEWNEYLHYNAPRGIQLIWGSEESPGYRGVRSVLDVAPTVLRLLGARENTVAQGRFVDLDQLGEHVDAERWGQLRALGYVAGR